MIHDLVGRVFSRLTVIEKAKNKGKKTAWDCLCTCGNTKITTTDSLLLGKTTSCGCRKLETARENCKAHCIKPRHGMTKSPTWNSWSSMIERSRGHGSGGRYKGMFVCERWKTFENFFEDMGFRPSEKTIDRIDVTKGYFPENCRWATATEQQRNRGNTRYVYVDGVKMCVMELAEMININKNAAQYYFSVQRKINSFNLKVEIKDGCHE